MATGLNLFVSSVRRGLEEERDVLPPLIRALGHVPLRFENYTAQPVPPREACLQGVEDADVYVLLLGEKYGEPILDTGLAPTEEEFNVARRRGIPILVFVKEGIRSEDRQVEFIRRVEEYTAGRFRKSFSSAADLQTKLVEAVRLVEQERAPLTWTPLDQMIEVAWIIDRDGVRTSSRGAILEVHILPLGPGRVAATALDALPARIAEAGRQYGFFGPGEGLDLGSDAAAAVVRTERKARRQERGIRITREGAATLWVELPRDMLGHILDSADVRARIAGMLRARWRRFRVALDLADPRDEAFARSGLAARLPEGLIAAILLIVDEDPEAWKIKLSPETWAWWQEAARAVVSGLPGSTTFGLVQWSEARDQRWGEFIALHWNGALQRGLASGVASTEPRAYLLPLVREIRRAIAFHREVIIPRTSAAGPWEVSLCFHGIEGSLLQPFTAQGGYYSHMETLCQEERALIRVELDEWPDDLVRQLAYRIAACWNVAPELVDHALRKEPDRP